MDILLYCAFMCDVWDTSVSVVTLCSCSRMYFMCCIRCAINEINKIKITPD